MKKAFLSILVLLVTISLVACGKKTTKDTNSMTLKDMSVEHDEKFGGVFIHITIDDFNKLGYEFGDAIKITFSTGYTLEDIPYYNGYYVDMGDPLLVGYPGYPYIRAGFNNGEDMWKEAGLQTELLTAPKNMWLQSGLNEKSTATVELVEKAKYLPIQNARDIHYSDEQGDLSNEEFANFRCVKVGNMLDNMLYRSASPCDNQHKRAAVTDALIKNVGVNFIVNLSDNAEELVKHIEKDDFNSPHFKSLYDNNNVIPLSMNMVFKSKEFSDKLVSGLTAMVEHTGPYLVHCVEGKDRTGYVVMVISALAGASYQELVDDYMITYANYYGITEELDKERYDVIKEKNIDVMLEYIVAGKGDIKTANYEECCTAYLKRIGMDESKITELKTILTGK